MPFLFSISTPFYCTTSLVRGGGGVMTIPASLVISVNSTLISSLGMKHQGKILIIIIITIFKFVMHTMLSMDLARLGLTMSRSHAFMPCCTVLLSSCLRMPETLIECDALWCTVVVCRESRPPRLAGC